LDRVHHLPDTVIGSSAAQVQVVGLELRGDALAPTHQDFARVTGVVCDTLSLV